MSYYTSLDDLEWNKPAGGYRAMLFDPPWRFKVRSQKSAGYSRAIERHYPTMALPDIIAMGPLIQRLAAPDSHGFLWVTAPFLEVWPQVSKAWGYRYSTIAFAWMKLNKRAGTLFFMPADIFMGLGYTTRQNIELCLLLRRGKPKRISKSVRQAVLAPLREHSRKPDEVRDRIMEYSEGPYCELFGRGRSTPDWDTWGNEPDKFSPLPAPRLDAGDAVRRIAAE